MAQFYNAWKPLTKKEFDIEWDTENIVFYFTSAYNSKELENSWRDIMFDMLPKISSIKAIKKEQLNSRSPDYYMADNLEDLQSKVAYMMPRKDVFGIARAFRTNSPLFMPMIIQDGDTYKTIGGRTRMSVAFIMDYPVKAIVIDKTKFRNLVILPIKRARYLSSDTFFTNSPETRQKLLDYVDGKISLEELKKDRELSIIEDRQLEFEIDMARRHSFKPELKKNPTMKTIDQKLLATAPSLDKIKEMIAKYWYTKPEKITLVQKSDSLWSIYQIGDIDYLDKMKRLHENGLIKMDENFVELKKGRYRFVYSPLVKSNPIKVKKGPREYGTRSGHKLNLAQALEIRANDYRTRDAQHDYDPSSVDERIYELQSRKSEREQAPNMNVRPLSKKMKFKNLEEFHNYLDGLSEKLNFWVQNISVEKLKLRFRPNFKEINSGDDWSHVYAFEDEVVKNLGGMVLAISPDPQSGTIAVDYIIPKNLRNDQKSATPKPKLKLVPKEKKIKPIKVKIKWLDNERGAYFAYLEYPDTPFYNVRLAPYLDERFKVSAFVGPQLIEERLFSNLKSAVDFAEIKFLAMASDDPYYDVSIMDA
jgi:hypothetical protein